MAERKKTERFALKTFKNPGGSRGYRVSGYWPDGKRERRNFKHKPDAIEHKAKIEAEAAGRESENTLQRTTLSPAQLRDAENAARHTDGESLSEIVSHYRQLREAVRAKADVSLDHAVEYFKENYRPEIEELSVAAARDEFLRTRKNLSDKTLAHYAQATKLLIEENPNKPTHRFSVGDIEQLLRRYTNPNSIRNRTRGMSVFFKWAVRFGYCVEDPCGRLDKLPKVRRKIAVLSVDEVRRLLKAATLLHGGVMAPSVAILLFAGLRPSELEELNTEDVRDDRIRVKGGKLRRELNRTVPVPPVLKSWLGAYPFAGRPGGWRYKMNKLKAATEPGEWVSDILRHTSISFQLERDKDEARTAFDNGTSVDMINQHYRDVIDDPDALKTFWELTPARVSDASINEKAIPGPPAAKWPPNGELLEMVRETSKKAVARKIGVSETAVRKRIKKMEGRNRENAGQTFLKPPE